MAKRKTKTYTESTPSQAPARHPAAVAWKAWMETQAYAEAADPYTLMATAADMYLRNRLDAAFQAGWEACERHALQATKGAE